MLIAASMFSNVGIGEAILKKYDILVSVANEIIAERAELYKKIYPDTKMITGDILDSKIFDLFVSECLKTKVQFLIATPPCQGMSTLGRMSETDPRNSLIIASVNAIKKISPKFVLIENVPKMPRTFISVDGKKTLIWDFIVKELGSIYKIDSAILNTADFKIPQFRKRCFLTLSKDGSFKIPTEKFSHITVKDAIGYLPSLESGECSNIPFHNALTHNAKHISWMQHTPTGKSAYENENKNEFYPQKDGRKIKGFKNTYKRIEWNRPCPTITMTSGVLSGSENVHPGNLKKDGTYDNARVLTLLEVFILSGIESSFYKNMSGLKESFIRGVIGEGIPPKMMEALVKGIKHD